MDLPPARSVSPTKETELSLDLDLKRSSANYSSAPSSAGLARTPTLSWQRRPQSQGPGPRSRPLSMFAAENAAARSSTPPAESTSPDNGPSRDQISQALASKDPSWFRQTADRGANSAAYRKNQTEDVDTLDVLSGRAQLPGMSRPTSTEPEREAVRSRPTSQIISRTGSPLLSMTEAQKLGPPADIQAGMDGLGSGRSSPTRPASPTKGMGGFVQSAMMKRTDSVKRWSVTTPGLQRGNTLVNRNSYDNKSGGNSPGQETTSRPVSRSRESLSRPTSSHGKDLAPAADTTLANENLPASPQPEVPKPEVLKPEEDTEKTPPTSPSRTMDPRRWSPSKGSSWLDAALKRPESPKPKPVSAASNQPAWMVELNRAKAERAKNPSVDIGRAGSAVKKHEVKTGGLVRPAPPGTTVKPPSLSNLKSPALPTEKPLTPGLRSGGSTRSPILEKPSPAAEEPERRASVAGPPTNKDNGESSPKKDFRTTLRARGTTLGNADKGQPVNELANVFGSLRKARTQNYVAPDELRNNITKGKAALNITGGPRPYEKKDEFKDAILKKKSEFNQAKQEGRGVAVNQKPVEEKPLPEGLVRRATISRSKSISHSRNSSVVKSPSDPPSQALVSPPPIESAAPSPRNSGVEETAPVEKVFQPGPSKEKSVPGRLPNKIGGALADRFNPALAGLLARGPPGMGGAPSSSGASSGTGASDAGKEPGPGPQLTHMTKNRVRGPRRKAPPSASKAPTTSAAAEPADASSSLPDDQESAAELPQKNSPSQPPSAAGEPAFVEASREDPKPEPVLSPKLSMVSPIASPVEQFKAMTADDKPRSGDVISPAESPTRRLAEQLPELTDSKGALVDTSRSRSTPGSPKKIHEQVAAIAVKALPAEEKKVEEHSSRSPSPRKLDVRRMSMFLDESSPSSPQNEPEVTRSPSPVKRAFGGPPSPLKLSEPEKVDSQSTESVKNGAAIFGRSLTSMKSPKQEDKPSEQSVEKHLPAPLNLRPVSPVKTVPATTLSAEPRESTFSPSLQSPTRSPSKSGSEVSAMLKDFFGNERSKRDYRVDAAEVLMNRPREGETVRTHNAQLFQITEQGKRVPVPTHYERVLFEREMYLCSHTFINAAGKKVQEVYFWVGDEVAPSAVEDAQVFVNREARSLGGTLIRIRQGKETAELIQALGGIIIIRRGSSNKYDSLASNMLCGRNYQGQIVFDQVDFAPLTLCSGFPYIINQSGKCYLWKGKGAGIDELSCARLIGMDSALMGELIEVEEGKEPDEFWTLFDGQKKMSSADHWRLKPTYDKYCGRLFCSDAADPRQVCSPAPRKHVQC